MPKVIVQANIKYKGERYEIGDKVTVNKSDLKDFEEAGVIAEILESKKNNKADDTEGDNDEENESEE
ncbi:DUF7210 family protein [Anaeromicrobium sediminis]|uniref:DUF7210 domain-containing protein n=1 Tax=Anaeromicrobium sediminis TaxID=1478221 RepID=A0A267MP00_9FIRM|nr:hypothetical protein [Anaeromicrobium sediminis]PAB61324.1 hypothetical protein CCE28_02510 [Anaeromicrobium sediminis]